MYVCMYVCMYVVYILTMCHLNAEGMAIETFPTAVRNIHIKYTGFPNGYSYLNSNYRQ
jgi:hypothetical protein